MITSLKILTICEGVENKVFWKQISEFISKEQVGINSKRKRQDKDGRPVKRRKCNDGSAVTSNSAIDNDARDIVCSEREHCFLPLLLTAAESGSITISK